MLAAKSFYVTVFHKSHFSHYCAIMAPYSQYLYRRVKHEEQSGAWFMSSCLHSSQNWGGFREIGKLFYREGSVELIASICLISENTQFELQVPPKVILLRWIRVNGFPVSVQQFQRTLETRVSEHTFDFRWLIGVPGISASNGVKRELQFLGPLALPPDVSWSHQDTPHSPSQAGGSRQIPALEPR